VPVADSMANVTWHFKRSATSKKLFSVDRNRRS
jgi:hypothetical protein